MATTSVLSAIPRRLEGKVALITGGARGIGECTAKLFAQQGAKVTIVDVQDELGHAVVKHIGPSNATYIRCDVTKEEDVKNAVDKVVAAHGKLDIMFNNAGICDSNLRILDNEKVDFERVLSTNVTGVFLGMKHAARVMVPARSGTIISTASVASRMGGVATHAYTCSKHAVVGLSKNVASELGQFGIRVNCVSPYAVATEISTGLFRKSVEELEQYLYSMAILKGTTMKAIDVANAALFLASDEAKYISGHNLFVDGAFTIANTNVAAQLGKHPDQS